jgi:hypothetical protein
MGWGVGWVRDAFVLSWPLAREGIYRAVRPPARLRPFSFLFK